MEGFEEELELFQESVYPLIYKELQTAYAPKMADIFVKHMKEYRRTLERVEETFKGVIDGRVRPSLNRIHSVRAIGVDAGYNGRNCLMAYLPIYAAVAVYCEGLSIAERPIVSFPKEGRLLFRPSSDLEEGVLHFEAQYEAALKALEKWDADILMFDGPLLPYRPLLKITESMKRIVAKCASLLRTCEERDVLLVGVIKRPETRKLVRYYPICFRCEERDECVFYHNSRVRSVLKCPTYWEYARKTVCPLICNKHETCTLGPGECDRLASAIAERGLYSVGRDVALLAPLLNKGAFTIGWQRFEDRGARELVNKALGDSMDAWRLGNIWTFYLKCKYAPFRLEVPDYCISRQEEVCEIVASYCERFPIPYPIYEADALTKITDFVSDECYVAFRKEVLKRVMSDPDLRGSGLEKLIQPMYGTRIGSWVREIKEEKLMEGRMT